jgi:hypothetical protein
LKFGGFVRGDRCSLRFGGDLSDGAKGEHVVTFDLALVGLTNVDSVPLLMIDRLYTIVKNGEVGDPLGPGPHEPLADVAEPSGFGELRMIPALERENDNVYYALNGLIYCFFDRRHQSRVSGDDPRFVFF